MSLIKIPFILAAIAGMHITLTAPQVPPPLEHESLAKAEGRIRVTHIVPIVKVIALDSSRIERTTYKDMPYQQCFLWALALTETIAIIIYHTELWSTTPLSPLPRYALSIFLLNSTSAAKMRLTPISVFGALLSFLGGLLRLYCYRALGSQFTFEISFRSQHKLITQGPYGVVRHPSYSAAFIAFTGIGIYHGAHGSWVNESDVLEHTIGRTVIGTMTLMSFAGLAGLVRRISTEDKMLRMQFGEEWEEWAKKVPYVTLPGLF
jgi:protein-S-isoprenylcysteine O-methyltransferase Ste14